MVSSNCKRSSTEKARKGGPPAGNIGQQTNNATNGRTQNYTYDPLNRLLTAQAQATSGGDCWGQGFGNNGPPVTMATDALANLFYTTSLKCSSPSPQFTMNTTNNNQFTGSGISYDSDGDMTADTVFTYTYDAENRVSTASGMSGGPYCYIYDGNGLRVMKAHASGGSCSVTVTVDMLFWRNIAGNTIAETDGTGSTTNSNYNEYIFFAARRIAQSNPASSNVYYYFVDHLGSIRVVTNATGTPCYEVDYLPYGNENTPSGFTNTCSTRYRFTGYERDLETAYGNSAGTDYAFARYYNSRLGRFMSSDPLDGDITEPQTLNHYAYVGDNPVNAVDPTGLCGTEYAYWCPILNLGDPGFFASVTNWCFMSNCGFSLSGGFPAPKPSQVKPPAPKPQPCAPPGHNPLNTAGIGLSGAAEAGLGAGRVLVGEGNILNSSNTPIAAEASWGPVQTATAPPHVYGAYVGGGGQVTFSNGEPGQLSGPFNVYSFHIGLLGFNGGGQMACSGSVCQISFSIPFASDGFGIAVSAYKTNAVVVTSGCKK